MKKRIRQMISLILSGAMLLSVTQYSSVLAEESLLLVDEEEEQIIVGEDSTSDVFVDQEQEEAETSEDQLFAPDDADSADDLFAESASMEEEDVVIEDETSSEEETSSETEVSTEPETDEGGESGYDFDFRQQPSDLTVKAGATAVFQVKAVGNNLSYQWQTKLNAGAAWGNTGLNGNKTDTLSFKAPSVYNGRQYRCIVTDRLGNTIVSDAATLTIAAITITAEPEDQTVTPGSSVSFHVAAEGTDLTYQWQTKLNESANWGNTGLSGNKTDTLSFKAPSVYNGRMYRCLITDSFGNQITSREAVLTVAAEPVSITAQPESITIDAGSTATFHVEASGSGLTYQWQTKLNEDAAWGNTGLNGSKTDTLNFTAYSAYNGRQYRCVVKDSTGAVVTSEAAVLSIAAVRIIAQPEDQTVKAGTEVSFHVEAQGSGLKYQWQTKLNETSNWGNTGLNGSKTATLSFKAPSVYNGRQYRCIVTDASGNSVTSDPAVLSIASVEITEQPADFTAFAGKNATFHVAANGTNLKYQWQTKLNESANWGNTGLNGSKTDTLSFNAPSAYNGRQYRCIITDASGISVTSDPAVLTVISVTIAQQPEDLIVGAGKPAQFHVSATGSGLTYQWQTKLNETADWGNTGLNGSKTDTLSFTAPSVYSGRQYRCVVKDKNGNAVTSDAATLTVSLSKITQEPEDVTVVPGTDVTLTVKASGDGLEYQWQTKLNEAAEWSNTELSGNQTDTLTFSAPETYNGSQYRCVITDALGYILVSKEITLTVEKPAVPEEYTTATTLTPGSTYPVSFTGTDAQAFYFRYEPAETDVYEIFSTLSDASHPVDSKVWLYRVTDDGELALIAESDDDRENKQFDLNQSLTSSEKYLYKVSTFNEKAATGDINVSFLRQSCITAMSLTMPETLHLPISFSGSENPLGAAVSVTDTNGTEGDAANWTTVWNSTIGADQYAADTVYAGYSGEKINVLIRDAAGNTYGIPWNQAGFTFRAGDVLQAAAYPETSETTEGWGSDSFALYAPETAGEFGVTYTLAAGDTLRFDFTASATDEYTVSFADQSGAGQAEAALWERSADSDPAYTLTQYTAVSQGDTVSLTSGKMYSLFVKIVDGGTYRFDVSNRKEASGITAEDITLSALGAASYLKHQYPVQISYEDGSTETFSGFTSFDGNSVYTGKTLNGDTITLQILPQSGGTTIPGDFSSDTVVTGETDAVVTVSSSGGDQIIEDTLHVTLTAPSTDGALSFENLSAAYDCGTNGMSVIPVTSAENVLYTVRVFPGSAHSVALYQKNGNAYTRKAYTAAAGRSWAHEITITPSMPCFVVLCADLQAEDALNVSGRVELQPAGYISADVVERATQLTPGQTYTADMDGMGHAYFAFTPDNTTEGNYVMFSSANADTYVDLYEISGNIGMAVLNDDDGGDNLNFRLVSGLESGKTYVYDVRFRNGDLDGTFPVTFEAMPAIENLTVTVPESISFMFPGYVLSQTEAQFNFQGQDTVLTVPDFSESVEIEGMIVNRIIHHFDEEAAGGGYLQVLRGQAQDGTILYLGLVQDALGEDLTIDQPYMEPGEWQLFIADEGGQVLYDQYIDLLTPDESGDAAVLTLDTAAAQTVAAGGIAVFSVDMSSVDSLLNYSVQQTCGGNTVVGILTGYFGGYGIEESMQRTISNAGGTVRTEYFAFADDDNFGYVAVYNPGSAAVDTTVTLKS